MEEQTTVTNPRLSNPFADLWVVVRGGGDIASGAIQRLRWAGFPLIVTELEKPLVVRRLVSFSNAVYEGQCLIERTPAKRVASVAEAQAYLEQEPEGVPVLVDPTAELLHEVRPTVLVDGRMAKQALDTHVDQAPIVIALGPGFEAGIHADAVIETAGGSQCGRAYFSGKPAEDSGVPCVSSGYRHERVLRAPISGTFQGCKDIGELVEAGEVVGWVHTDGAAKVPVKTQISGVLRGLLHSDLEVIEGVKLGDLDHRGESSDCCRVSEKADSVASGVLEAVARLGIVKGLFARAPERAASGKGRRATA